ncbi:MAG: zinc ABC transporter substrate-binding protein, partial [Spirochaetales bacterium]|nr:zinc ABC transporter substrate-binding protein [Spirochaetales bacterium]
MNRTRKSFVAFSFILGLAASLFASGGQEEVSDKQTYFVSILPQAYFLERIGGDRIDVTVMVPPGKSPATYEPTPRQVVELGEATAFFTIGVPFEQTFLPSLEGSLPNLPLIDTSAGIEKRFIEAHSHDDEEGHDEDHHEGDEDHDDHH